MGIRRGVWGDGRAPRARDFGAVNRNKRGIVLNLKEPKAQEVARKLAAQADIWVENYRPGVMAAFGLGYKDLREINPSLIYASVSGFGSTGPYAKKGGFDLVAQGMSGIVDLQSVDDHPFIDPDCKSTTRINTGPDLIFEGCPVWTKVRERDEHTWPTFSTLR